MAIDKRLQIYDEQGNLVDYDILASDVKFLPDGKDLPTKLAEMQDEIGEGGYTPPQGGIPKTDLAPSVQTSLDKADSAYQKPASGIPASDIADGVIPDTSNLATKTELAGKVDKNGTDSLMTAAEHTKLGNLPTADQLATQMNAKANDNAVVKAISVNGGTPSTPVNGNVNISVEGGSQIDPATAAPVMDGTAAVGTSTKYAREDHVHPHDTSKQDTLQYDELPAANSQKMVKSGGIHTALQNLLANITIDSTTGNWKIGSTDTGIKARGTDGVASGDDVVVVHNLLGDPANLEQGQRAVLGADIGSILGNKARVVLDEIDSEYTNNAKPTAADVPADGLLCYNPATEKIYYFYVDNSVVECLVCDPDPRVIYCLADSNITMRWTSDDGWQQVGGSGSGVTIQHESGQCRIIFGASGGGGADLNIPTITATWANSDKFSDSNTSKILNITWKHLTVGDVISIQGSTHYSCQSSITADAASGNGTLTIVSTATDEGAETIHVVSGDIDVSVSCEFESVYAIKATDGANADDISTNAALCAQLHSVGYVALDGTTKQTASEDGILKTEITDIKSFPEGFAYASNYSAVANAMKGTLDLRKFTALTSIGKNAFNCCKVKSILLPEQGFSIGEGAFNQYNTNGTTTSVDLGGCTSIGKGAFHTNKITSLVIPASVTSIGDNAFYLNANLTSVEFLHTAEDNKPTLGAGAFKRNSGGNLLVTDVYVHKETAINIPSGNPGYNAAWYSGDIANGNAQVPSGNGGTLHVPSATAQTNFGAVLGWNKFTIVVESNE